VEVKEIKSFLCGLAVNSFAYKRKDIKKEYEKIDEVISLLQQFYKYKQMWKELWNDIEEKEERCEVACDIVYVSQLRELKQKYFPKEAKQNKG